MRETSYPEAVPTPSPQDSELQPGAILAEAIKLNFSHFLSLSGLALTHIFLAVAAIVLISSAGWPKLAEQTLRLFVPLATMGIVRGVLMNKTVGRPITFSDNFGHGLSLWWSGFRLDFLLNLLGIGLGLVSLLFLIPGFVIWEGNQIAKIISVVLLVLFLMISLIWLINRSCLSYGILADRSCGARDAIKASFEMTKGRTGNFCLILLGLIGIGIALLILGFIGIFIVAAASELSPGTFVDMEKVGEIFGFILVFFFVSMMAGIAHASYVLAYCKIRHRY